MHKNIIIPIINTNDNNKYQIKKNIINKEESKNHSNILIPIIDNFDKSSNNKNNLIIPTINTEIIVDNKLTKNLEKSDG